MSRNFTVKFAAPSERVKSVDIHPSEPWLLTTLYNGVICIWNYEKETLVKTIEVTELPIRSGKFIARKQWIVIGADDDQIRVYNTSTFDLVKKWDAHSDYIRGIAVHPTASFVLSCSDDYTIKRWDWEKDWSLGLQYEGHEHYVMCVAFNPKDPTLFASASVDGTVKIWGLNSSVPQMTLLTHEKGCNSVSFYHGIDRTHIITAGDDTLIKIWDLQSKACIAELQGHLENVSFAIYHPSLPIIISGSEDGSARVWSGASYSLEETINCNLSRLWAISTLPDNNRIALGGDDGACVIKCGHERPVLSVDSGGHIVWAKNIQLEYATPIIPQTASQSSSSSSSSSSSPPNAILLLSIEQ
ncbi:MAG: putative Coatomer subunit beta', partial [Streblomastix strix]